MSAKSHRPCYGKIIPDFSHVDCNKPIEGMAFRASIEKIGIGSQRREVEIKSDAWDECLECPEYRTCYDLGMARLALHSALGACQ